MVLLFGKYRKEISAGYKLTTNNRMELMAAIEGLKALKEPCTVKLYSDSRYVVDGIQLGWAKRWQANHWWRTMMADPTLTPGGAYTRCRAAKTGCEPVRLAWVLCGKPQMGFEKLGNILQRLGGLR